MTLVSIRANTTTYPGIASWVSYTATDDSDMEVYLTMSDDGVLSVFEDYGMDGNLHHARYSATCIAYDMGVDMGDHDRAHEVFHAHVVPLLIRGIVFGEVIRYSEVH